MLSPGGSPVRLAASLEAVDASPKLSARAVKTPAKSMLCNMIEQAKAAHQSGSLSEDTILAAEPTPEARGGWVGGALSPSQSGLLATADSRYGNTGQRVSQTLRRTASGPALSAAPANALPGQRPSFMQSNQPPSAWPESTSVRLAHLQAQARSVGLANQHHRVQSAARAPGAGLGDAPSMGAMGAPPVVGAAMDLRGCPTLARTQGGMQRRERRSFGR